MRYPWRRRARESRREQQAPPRRLPGVTQVNTWIDAVTTGLADGAARSPEAAAARACDALFTSATVAAVMVERGRPCPEYRAVHQRCLAGAIEFMKLLGEDTLRRHRVHTRTPLGWDELGPADAVAIAEHLAVLGEALQIALCALTTDPALGPELREIADTHGLPAAAVIVDSCQSIRADPAL